MYVPTVESNPSLISMGTDSVESCGLDSRATGLANAASAAWPLANLALFIPIALSQPYTARMMYCFNGATASGNLDLGIYDEAGNRLVSMGSTAQAGTSVIQRLDITDTVLGGPARFYMALACNAITLTFQSHLPPNLWNIRALGVMEMQTAFPLPNPATYAVTSRLYLPVIGIMGEITS